MSDPADAERLRTTVESLRGQVDRLTEERARLEGELRNRPATGRRRLRRWMTPVLAGVCCLLIFLSVITVWVHQTVISTSGFVSTVGPIVEQPAVSQAMSVELTDQIFGAIDVQGHVKQALPSAGKFLASPLESAARSFVQDKLVTVLESSQFRTVWTSVLRGTHSQVIAALRGQNDVLQITNGAVVLNVLPLVDAALQQVQSAASGLLGRDITIPTITSAQLSPETQARLSDALGVQLPANFGQIELARSQSLNVASNVVELLDVLFWLLPLLTLVVIVAALSLSTNRRRTSLQILVGTGVALVVERRAGSWAQSRIVASIDPANRAAGHAILHQIFSGLATATWWLLLIVVVAVALLLLTGPYRWARALRRRPSLTWMVGHRRALQVAGAAVGGVLLFVVPGWWFFVVAVAVAAYEVALWRAGSRELSPIPPPPGPG